MFRAWCGRTWLYCFSHRPVVVVLDMTSTRSDAALGDARTFAEALAEHLPNGKPLIIYHHQGIRMDLVTPRNGVVKPTPCPKRHPIFSVGQPDCSDSGYEKARAALLSAIETGFSPYFEDSDAPKSRPFSALARVATDLALGRGVGGDIIYLSDGLPYSDVARFSPTADWLDEEAARQELQERLVLRGLLPDLRGYRIHMVGIGRSLNGSSTLTGETTAQVVDLWSWYASLTGAVLSVTANFGASSVSPLKNLENPDA